MGIGQWIVVLICAALGFGIVTNMMNASRKPDPPDEDPPGDHGGA